MFFLIQKSAIGLRLTMETFRLKGELQLELYMRESLGQFCNIFSLT